MLLWCKTPINLGIMMTSSNPGNMILRVTDHLCGEWFPAQRPVTRSFDVFYDLRLNKRLSKQSWGWWFETLSRPLWRHRNVVYIKWPSKRYKGIYRQYPRMKNIRHNVGKTCRLWASIHQAVRRLTAKSREVSRLGVIMTVSLWNLTGISAAVLPRCLSNFRAMGNF